MRIQLSSVILSAAISSGIILTGTLFFRSLIPHMARRTSSNTLQERDSGYDLESHSSVGVRRRVTYSEEASVAFGKDLLRDLKELLHDDVTEDDPRLVALIRRYIFPPSRGLTKMSYRIGPPPQAQMAMDIFKTQNLKHGFFVECGALDGERSSNTYHLEKNGWTGVLIEADPYYFLQIVGKRRRAWKLNACLSPTGKPDIMNFRESSGGAGKVSATGHQVACFPLYSILKALNRTRVDFFSLDVEGAEMAVLRTTPYDKLDVRAITMEYIHNSENKTTMKDFMASKGYQFYRQIDKTDTRIGLYTHDFFFVKRDSK